ncbi:hypothetical protein VTO42DRAFT_4672 [Malbranchea cinnamomea]
MTETKGHPNLNLTPEEKRVFGQLFKEADKTNLGVVTGEAAVPFFEKTGLPTETLGLIWQIADTENRGLLTPSGFSMVLRLIGHAQAGRAPVEELAFQPGPLPKFAGINTDPPRPVSAAGSPPPFGGPVRVPPLNPDDISKFTALFEKSDTQGGLISGEIAKQIFERARLPNEVLGRIWNLADTKQRGALDATEFIIAMHLLTAYKMGTMRGIPQSLPPGLYEAAAKRSGRASVGSRSPSDVPPVPAIPKQFSGSGPQRTQSPLNRSQFPSNLQPQTTGGDWLITPQEKAQFDAVFATVDRGKTGFINGDQAVGFFSNAQLPEETLAQIWDLADMDADGQLNRDEFAVAMYLVRQQRLTREPLPQTLPPALVPPSVRQQRVASPPRPIQQQVTGQRSATEDLFGLDVFSASPQVPQSTGGSNPLPHHAPASPPPRPATQSTTFKPFVPTSSFGQSLTPHTTGAAQSPVRSPPQPSDDLLGDADPEESKKLTQETADLANLSNQIGTLSKELQSVQTKRATAEQDLAQTSQQKRDFEARLAQARTMYEQEVRDFKALEERLAASRAETNKLQQEYSMLEANRQDLQAQHNQVSAALEADQRENANLKEKICQVNAQINQLKQQLEKARSEARQQKGLVAINKKQLATVEAERDKLEEELDSATKKTPEGLEQQTTGSSVPLTSPAASTASQKTNPFFRRATTSPETAFTLSAQNEGGQKDAQSVFDNVFGPSFSIPPSTASPPPPTTFRTESPAQASGSRLASPQPQDIEAAKTSTPSSTSPSVSQSASAEPPPPPQSRQISADQLPIPGHQSAEPSSVQPSPPTSRYGENSQAAVNQETSPFEFPSEQQGTSKDSSDAEPAQNAPGAFPTGLSSGAKKDLSFDELFGGKVHQRSQSQKAQDFEEAFAAMKARPAQDASNSNGDFAGEFPPIRELGDDDDSSSDSDVPAGFDDDFAPASPQQGGSQSPEAFKFPSIEKVSSGDMPLPGPNAEQSPSQHERKEGPGSPPSEFKGRNNQAAASDAPHSVESLTGAPIIGGAPHQTTDNGSASGPGSKNPDFEAAFAGLDLAPAKESDDSSDDDDFGSPFNNKGPSNFDMSFDTPSSTSKSAQNAANNSNFFNFDANDTKSPASQPSAQQGTSPQGNQSSHDWDALFSVLDASKGGTNGNNENKTEPTASAQAEGVSALSFPQPPNQSKPPGWALSVDSGEDDQLLQRLTAMGYPRDESLAALEKFDYNLDKAADFLASKS